MTRGAAAWIALAMLLGLTLLTWRVAQDELAPWMLALVASIKVAVIGVVFLELAWSWWGWAAIYLGGLVAVLFGAAVLLSA